MEQLFAIIAHLVCCKYKKNMHCGEDVKYKMATVHSLTPTVKCRLAR